MALCGKRFDDVYIGNRVPRGGGGVVVWAGKSYGQRTQMHFIDGNLNAQRYCDGPLSCHSSTTIISCFSKIMHGPMSRGSVHNSWKLKMSQFFHGLHTHQTRHPLSMFGMLWIDVYDNVFLFPPISTNFAQPLKRSGTIHHRFVTLHEANGGHIRYWLVFWTTPQSISWRYLWPTDAYLYSPVMWNP